MKPFKDKATLDVGVLYPKQIEFVTSKKRYTAYGGARGGGKTHALRKLAEVGALQYPGIKILIVRRLFTELQKNHIEPICKDVSSALGRYNVQLHTMYFVNGSIIQFGHFQSYDTAFQEYQGQEYDWILIDEATQFCVHPDTELLLRRGWTRVDQTFRGDEVLSLNPDGTQAYKPIEQMYCFPTSENLYECNQHSGASFCVTHGHKIPVLDKVNGGWKFKQVQDIKDDYIARIGTAINQPEIQWYTDLPHHRKGHNEADRILMDDWLEFLGWYLSEGSSFVRGDTGHSPKINIRQTKPQPTLDALFERLPYRYTHTQDGQYLVYSGQLFDVLHPMGDTYSKRVPDYVFGLSARQINIFLKAFELGDGHYDKNGAIHIGLANEGLIDDLQRLYSIVGRVATKGHSIARGKFDVWRLSIRLEDKHYSRCSHDIKTVPYDGLVWCPVVSDNHNFVIRYNGRVSVTGNTYQEFRLLGGCLRGVNDIPKHFYLTCNPGGIGHQWVKRLFIDRDFKTDSANPEENENPDDYLFIQALVEDNKALMGTPDGAAYKGMLSSLPENIRAAHRYGDWNALSGQYFPEFTTAHHVCKPFPIPDHWQRYRAFDYGLDMLACLWAAIDEAGRIYIYRELKMPNLIVTDAAELIKSNTGRNEKIQITFAPPDMWNRQKDTGKSMAELFMLNDVPIIKADNQRVQGWLQVKECLKDVGGKPIMMIFDTCKELISDLQTIQASEKNPNDCATEPHEITHSCDSLRYLCVSRTLPTEALSGPPVYDDYEDSVESYEDHMTGGVVTSDYIGY